MARYKLTKGSLSRIRYDRAGCEELVQQGYRLDGEVNDKNELVDDRVRLDDIDGKPKGDPEKDHLVEKARELGLGAPSALKRLSPDTLRDRIEEAEAAEE